MLGTAPARAQGFYLPAARKKIRAGAHGDRWSELAASTIFVLGSPRSGTTWLAKIFDSHPDILYRHEPDELARPSTGLDPAEQVREWLLQRGLRTAAKRPNFPKSWRPVSLESMRRVLASVLAAAQRLPLTSSVAERVSLPDLIPPSRWQSVRTAIKLVNWDGSAATRAMPDTRCLLILRHPCGQIASMMAGVSARQFATMADESGAPIDLTAAVAWAARHGVEAAAFASLPDAAKYAWSWLAFNEPAVEELRSLPNARIVVYEDLCWRPEAVSRDLFAFAGLSWHPNTAAFLGTSTRHDGTIGYYDVFRVTGLVADRWRQTMSPRDQDAVRTVIATSSLARCWPDLTSAAP